MQKIILALTLFTYSVTLHGQIVDDVYHSKKNNSPIESTKKSTSKIGSYLSFGFSKTKSPVGSGTGLLIDYSIAYKSHLITTMLGYYPGGELHDYYKKHYSATLSGLMLGEAFRSKNLFLSLSAGISNTSISYNREVPSNSVSTSWEMINFDQVSFLAELKLFLHFYNGVGIGFNHMTATTTIGYVHYNSITILVGHWNNTKKK